LHFINYAESAGGCLDIRVAAPPRSSAVVVRTLFPLSESRAYPLESGGLFFQAPVPETYTCFSVEFE
jgi:hypothetical protein